MNIRTKNTTSLSGVFSANAKNITGDVFATSGDVYASDSDFDCE